MAMNTMPGTRVPETDSPLIASVPKTITIPKLDESPENSPVGYRSSSRWSNERIRSCEATGSGVPEMTQGTAGSNDTSILNTIGETGANMIFGPDVLASGTSSFVFSSIGN